MLLASWTPPVTQNAELPRLFDFFQKSWAVLEPGRKLHSNWHQELICEYLEAVHIGQIKRLLINIAPRHLKSTIVSMCFPCWEWIESPWLRYLCLSYSGRLATKHSLKRRSLVQSLWYQSNYPLQLMKDHNLKTEFANGNLGQMYSSGLGGTVMGEGGDRIIVDDPHDPEAAESVTQRESTLEAFNEAIGTRLNDPTSGAIIIVMQRVHEKDVSGHILSEVGGYEHLCLPTECEEPTTLYFPLSHRSITRQPGEFLHPERFNKDKAEEAKKILGSYGYAGRHQQRPVPREGGMVKLEWFRRYVEPPSDFIRIIQSWDTASKAKDINCPWVGGTWGERPNGHLYLLHVLRRRMEYPEGKKTVIALAEEWEPDVVLIEDKSTGQSLIPELREIKINGRSIRVIAIEPEGDKVTRMSVQTVAIESGHVFLPQSAAWLPDYEIEIGTFPLSANNDQVDMTSQLLKWARGKRRILPSFGNG